jgi:HlyD family secretion protein
VDAQLAARRARLAQDQNAYERVQDQVEALFVRPGLAGAVLEVMAEEGEQVQPGTNIARVARPDDLRAELRVSETQARDVQVGQFVAVDTRNGIVEGKVERIDPGSSEGTVQVDVELTGKLPRGARPDLSVDGTIEITRLDDAVQMGRPTYSQQNSTIKLFKVVEQGRYAIQVPVEIGLTSVNTVEILQGLVPGDEVILSDTSAWDDNDRIRLN